MLPHIALKICTSVVTPAIAKLAVRTSEEKKVVITKRNILDQFQGPTLLVTENVMVLHFMKDHPYLETKREAEVIFAELIDGLAGLLSGKRTVASFHNCSEIYISEIT